MKAADMAENIFYGKIEAALAASIFFFRETEFSLKIFSDLLTNDNT